MIGGAKSHQSVVSWGSRLQPQTEEVRGCHISYLLFFQTKTGDELSCQRVQGSGMVM